MNQPNQIAKPDHGCEPKEIELGLVRGQRHVTVAAEAAQMSVPDHALCPSGEFLLHPRSVHT